MIQRVKHEKALFQDFSIYGYIGATHQFDQASIAISNLKKNNIGDNIINE